MGLSFAYQHSLLQLPPLHVLSRHEFGEKPSNTSLKEISITSSSGLRTRKNLFPVIRVLSSKGGEAWSEDSDVQRLNERRSPLSPNKEEILALFKRIQASISDGEASISKKRTSKSDDEDTTGNKPAADTILDVLRQPRTRAKGKTIGKKRDKVQAASQPDSTKTEKIQDLVSDDEESDENLPVASVKPSRPVSIFSRKSPIPAGVSSWRKNKIDLLEDGEESSEREDAGEQQQTEKFEEMKLTQLKEVAKSKGIKGYSKLKKSELVELLLKS